ncbi:hypothetical protein Pla175_14670 [Pirellulimonas nuda]|uniref:Chromosome partition protein Smc n=1 Tax=Pirellulimonas nuda TaxID=2528009 RepID=A0A518D9J0_9BACT|nr:hypothetical protein [Pirellulimonas nuda]QDU88096.1 hypothetical protein Pla175_14670 [Pirellulimonas nuda]
MSANVRSTDAILAVRAAAVNFADQVRLGLDEIETELRRLLDWIEHDRPGYWREQLRRSWDEVAQARAELNRKLMYPVADERPACVEQRKALRRAEQRQAYCEAKFQRLREWVRDLQHELDEYRGRVNSLKQLADVEAPAAVAALDRVLASLSRYASGRASAPPAAAPSEAPGPISEEPT